VIFFGAVASNAVIFPLFHPSELRSFTHSLSELSRNKIDQMEPANYFHRYL